MTSISINPSCCSDSCRIGIDDFDRPDAPTLGECWDERYGDWSIDTKAAKTSFGMAIYKIRHSVPDESMVVSIDTLDESIGDIYQLILNYLDDDNYHIAELLIGSALRIRLGVVAGGNYTELAAEDVSGQAGLERTFKARIGSEEFCAEVTNAVQSLVFTRPSLFPEGYYSGMGAEGDYGEHEEMRMRNFLFEQHAETNPECQRCICGCEMISLPPILYANFTGEGRMSGVTGCSIELEWNRIENAWLGTDSCCNSGFSLHLTCGADGDPLKFKLGFNYGCVDGDNPPPPDVPKIRSASEGSTCDPLLLIFGPYFTPASDLTCFCGEQMQDDGEFIVEVTK